MGKEKFQRNKAALQHRHDWPRRSWQDVADGCNHKGFGRNGRRDATRPMIRSTRRRKRKRAASRSRRRMSNTRPRTAITRMSIAPATPTM